MAVLRNMVEVEEEAVSIERFHQSRSEGMSKAEGGRWVRYDDHAKLLSARLQQLEELKELVRRAVEWTPTFPLEASLADEMAKAIGYEVPQTEKP